MSWQPIDTYKMPEGDEWTGDPVLVDNGVRVGEARPKQDYSAWDDESPEIPMTWGWTHHSTCGCCYSPMEPQPLWWQPLPPPAIPRNLPDAANDTAQDSSA
jgi:hypothetical protein